MSGFLASVACITFEAVSEPMNLINAFQYHPIAAVLALLDLP